MNSNYKIKLVNDTITKGDITALTDWLTINPRLTKGSKTIEFENKWANWQQTKHSVFVNSGSSANLAMFYALMLSGRMKNKKVIVPAVSWVTTVSPVIQLGLEPILCDTDTDTLGVDINHLKSLINKHKPAVLIIVHVLGVPNKMDEIMQLCRENDVILLEDSCESVGSRYNHIKTGNFGLMSSFSTYYGHHFSTIEGGIVNTNDDQLYNILLSIRSHGWDRDLPEKEQTRLRNLYSISDFRAFYTFYYPGFNLRSTDLQAFIGIQQLQRIDKIVEKRNSNFRLYQSLIKNDYWKIKEPGNVFISNFAYPVIAPEKKFSMLVTALHNQGVEIRPLVCGSISEQPFWKNINGGALNKNSFAVTVHDQGLCLPNNYQITEKEISFVCDVVNAILE